LPLFSMLLHALYNQVAVFFAVRWWATRARAWENCSLFQVLLEELVEAVLA
jgi:hypothetical protein